MLKGLTTATKFRDGNKTKKNLESIYLVKISVLNISFFDNFLTEILFVTQ